MASRIATVVFLALGSTDGFLHPQPRALRAPTAAHASKLEDVRNAVAATLLGVSMVFAPVLTGLPDEAFAAPAATRQNAATAAGSRVNKDADSLLRLGLPIDNPPVRKLQTQIEGVGGDIRVKRIGAAVDGCQKARETIKSKGSAMLSSVRATEKAKGEKLLAEIDETLSPAIAALSVQSAQGSIQERAALDNAIAAQVKAAGKLSELEELMVPEGYTVAIPDEFKNLPVLQGRAVVEMLLKKGEAGESLHWAVLNYGI